MSLKNRVRRIELVWRPRLQKPVLTPEQRKDMHEIIARARANPDGYGLNTEARALLGIGPKRKRK